MYQGPNAKSGISNLNLGQGLFTEDQQPDPYQGPNAKSGISNLNLGAGLFSEEPQTALLVKNDNTLSKLQKCSPSTNNFNSITPDEDKKQIDEMYEVRQS